MEHKFGEIVAPTKQELFIRRIQSMILSEELQPGDTLPTERELAEEMKISKTLVHDGLRELTRLGFLDITSRRGVVVADYAKTGNIETLLSIMKFQDYNLDRRTAYSLLDVRFYLEAPAILAISKDPKPEKLQELQNIVGETRENRDRGLAYLLEKEMEFHHTILLLSGNTLTPLIFNAFRQASQKFWTEYLNRLGADKTIEMMDLYIQYLADGRGQEVVDMLQSGIEEYKKIY